MYKQNGSRDTCFEALIVRVPWPDWIAELERTRYDNPKFVPVELVDATRGYDSECAVLFPETGVGGRASAQQLRRDLLRSRGRAAAASRRRRRRAPAAQPPARRRAACCAATETLAAGLHPLGPDPRPRSQPRRPAVRPVHDPPARPLLDVLAGGAALRPDRLRRGARRSSARGSRSPATCSTRSCSTGCCASRSPGRACATTTGSAASCCSPTCTAGGYLHWTDNRLTIEWEQVAEGVLRAARRGPGAVPRRDRPHEAPALGGGARSRRGQRPARDRARSGRSAVREFRDVEDPRPYCRPRAR